MRKQNLNKNIQHVFNNFSMWLPFHIQFNSYYLYYSIIRLGSNVYMQNVIFRKKLSQHFKGGGDSGRYCCLKCCNMYYTFKFTFIAFHHKLDDRSKNVKSHHWTTTSFESNRKTGWSINILYSFKISSLDDYFIQK